MVDKEIPMHIFLDTLCILYFHVDHFKKSVPEIMKIPKVNEHGDDDDLVGDLDI